MDAVEQCSNFTRMDLPDKDILTNIIRSILQLYSPASELEVKLNNLSAKREKTMGISEKEWDLLHDAAKNKSYENIDISLMCRIFPYLRDCWKKSRSGSEKKLRGEKSQFFEDIVEKIGLFRNYLAHVPRHAISKDNFDEKWKELQSICLKFDQIIGSNFSQKLKSYHECVVDVDVDACLFNDSQSRILHSEVFLEEFSKKTVIKEEWMKEMKRFYPTRACKEVENQLHVSYSVTVVGNPGCGKSSIAQYVSLSYTSKNWAIIPVDGIKDIISLTEKHPQHEQLFVLNDPLGKDHIDKYLLGQWKNHESALESYLKTYKNKIVFTCRTNVLNEKRVPDLLNLNKIIIDDAKWKLTKNEKEHILDLHLRFPNDLDLKLSTNKIEQTLYYRCPKVILPISDHEKTEILKCEEYFLQLCELFVKHEKYRSMGSKFFARYHAILRDEISNLKATDKMKFCALVILFAEGGIIHSESLLKSKRTFETTFDSCGLPRNTSLASMIEELRTLDGSFVKKNGKKYTFRDEKVMHATANAFGETEQMELIRICPFEFLSKNVDIIDMSCIIKTKVAYVYVSFTDELLDVICDRYFQEMKINNEEVRHWSVLQDARVRDAITERKLMSKI